MTLRYSIIVFIFCFLAINSIAQGINLKVDSIKLYHIPLSIGSPLAFTNTDVRNFNSTIEGKRILKTELISDSLSISQFSEINITDPSNITDFNHGIDVRIVIDIYLEFGHCFTISMDKKGYYIIENEKFQRSRNRILNNWLQTFIPELQKYAQ